AQAGPIVDALTRSGIPVQKRSHDRLLDRAGVAAIARELRFASGLGGSLAARVRLTVRGLVERPGLDVVGSAALGSRRGGGAPVVLRRAHPGAGPAVRVPRAASVPARVRAGDGRDAVP